MQKFDPHCHTVNIQKAIGGFIVTVGCQGPIVVSSYEQLEEELRGFFSGSLGPLGKKVWDAYAASIQENSGCATQSCAPTPTIAFPPPLRC